MVHRNHNRELSYAVRLRVILKYSGQLTLAVGVLNIVPAVVAVGVGDLEAAARYALVALGTTAFGSLTGWIRAPTELQANEAMVVVALAFLIAAAAMVYPFGAAGLGVSDGVFEAVSGVTTTGLTTVASVEDKPVSFLFARAWLQWYGGLGIVVLWAALAFGKGGVSKALQDLSPTEDLVGGTIACSRRVLVIYCLLTFTLFAVLAATGIPAFTALLHTLAAVSTGGFSSFDQSLAGLTSSLAVAVIIISCVAGALPTMGYYRAWRRGIAELLGDRQLWCLLGLGLAVSAALIPWMPSGGTASLVNKAGNAMATAFSAQTTAGFSTFEVSRLEPAAKAVLVLSMAVGGGAGSTAGGLKLLRLVILMRFVQSMLFRSSLPPHAVDAPRLAGRRLNSRELHDACAYLTMGLLVVAGSWLVFLAMNYDPLDSLFEVVSATGTVGLSTGLAGPRLPPLLKGVLCVDMLMGRLEIVAFAVFLYPRTWIGKRRHVS